MCRVLADGLELAGFAALVLAATVAGAAYSLLTVAVLIVCGPPALLGVGLMSLADAVRRSRP